jgi:peroxiredoxin
MLVSVGQLVALAVLSVTPVPDLELSAADGTTVRLSAHAGGRPVAVVFLGPDCPLANLYGPRLRDLAARLDSKGVRMLAVASGRDAEAPAVAPFARTHQLPFPCLLDPTGTFADAVGATRTPQAVILDASRRVRYRGRIDDQYRADGPDRARPTREDLFEAAREVAAGQPVSVPTTRATGCVLSRRPARPPATPSVTFSRDVWPILRDHCAGCHRPGEVGPFPLLTFADARKRAETIADVVADGRMPPWHASPHHGRFRNDRSLSARQKQIIADWVRLGCPEGEPVIAPPPAAEPDRWAIGRPDVVYPIPAPFHVPADGLIEYQHFLVDPGLTEDVWVTAAEVRAGNRRVVHHCNIFLHPPGSTDPTELFATGDLGSSNLVAWTPGTGPVRLPPGMAKVIPAGWRLHFVVHYTAVGTPQVDRTELGLKLCPAAEVRQEVATQLLQDLDFTIPPHASRHRVEMSWRADQDVLLMSMFPHMHFRGRSFRYAAEFPDGSREILLDVPAYDFDWQHRYELSEPRRLPAGTVIRCTAEYDNSAANPANPDPAATVRSGSQSTDEMFNGFFDIALADQDLAAERAAVAAAGRRQVVLVWLGLGAAVVAAGTWACWRRGRRSPIPIA